MSAFQLINALNIVSPGDAFPDPFALSNNWSQYKIALDALDASSQTTQTATALADTGFSGGDKWRGLCSIPDNKAVGVRYGETQILVVDFDDDSFTMGIDIADSTSYAGQYALNYDDNDVLCLWAAPLGGPNILKLDLSKDLLTDETAITRYHITGFGTDNSQKFYGCKRAFNGNVYCAPYLASNGSVSCVAVIRPDGTFYSIPLDAIYNNGFRGFVLDKFGRLWAVPYDATKTFYIDPTNDTVTYINHASFSTTAKWDNGCTDSVGYPVFAPNAQGSMGRINADTDTFSTFSSGLGSCDTIRMLPNGHMIGSLVNGGRFTDVDPINQTTALFGPNPVPGSDRFRGVAGNQNGQLIMGLFDAQISYKIGSAFPVSENFVLSPFING